MDQTTTTATTTQLSDVDEALRLKVYEDGKFLYDNSDSVVARERLIHTIQSNDCRAILSAAVDCDDLAKVFCDAGFKTHPDVLQVLLDHGMNVDARNHLGFTALIYSAWVESEECVRLLLNRNANIDVQNTAGTSALMSTADSRDVNIVKILLERKPNLDLQDGNGNSALMRACQRDRKEMVELLLSHGADVDLKNKDGKTAINLTKKKPIKELLRNHASTAGYVLK